MFVKKLKMFCLKLYVLIVFCNLVQCDVQVGPDPWDLEINDKLNQVQNEQIIPPDLKAIPPKKTYLSHRSGPGDWFYKRMLAIMLKAGQIKIEEDGTVFVSLQMKFDKDRWQLLESYSAVNLALTDDIIRRSMGYIEEAIYKPTIIEKAWSEYVQFYLIEYKVHLTWTFGILALIIASLCLWKHVSHKHIYIVLFILLYLYEVFTSYKEAEREDLQRFLNAVNTCKWYFWSSQCDVLPPDPLIFIKYMNPMKIGIRMFATVITEPMFSISETAGDITDGLWFPFDKIFYGVLIMTFYSVYIVFVMMILFNYILNTPFNFSYLGLFNIGLSQRHRSSTTFTNSTERPVTQSEDGDRISGATLNILLDVCSRALSTAEIAQNNNRRTNTNLPLTNSVTTCRIRRSASTGRLPTSRDSFEQLQIDNSPKLNLKSKGKINGSGDWFR